MLEQFCNYSEQCRNNVATRCCSKNRRCESSLVTSPLKVVAKQNEGQNQYPKVMFHRSIRNDDFKRNTSLEYWNNVAKLCCAKNRRCESSRVTSS